jgi:hypothetical protein
MITEQGVAKIISSIQNAIDEDAKSISIKRIEKILDRIDTEILDNEIITGISDLESAIEEYRDIEREGLTPEEYQDEKSSAFEAIMDAVNDIDIDEDAIAEINKEKDLTIITNPDEYTVGG